MVPFPNLGTIITSSTAITTSLSDYLTLTVLAWVVGIAVAAGIIIFLRRQLVGFVKRVLGGNRGSRRGRYAR